MHSLQQQSGLVRQSAQGVQRLPSSRQNSSAHVKQLHHQIFQEHMLAAPVTFPCMAPSLQHLQQQQHGRRRFSAVTKAGPPEQHSCNDSKKKLAVFVSGGGSNSKAIHAACLKGQINADVVVSHNKEAQNMAAWLACPLLLYMCTLPPTHATSSCSASDINGSLTMRNQRSCCIATSTCNPTCASPFHLQAVVSDLPSCGGVAYAQQHGIPTLTYPASKKGLFPGLTPQELVQQLKHELGADYVLLAGYLKV
jgi:hypothetical protein